MRTITRMLCSVLATGLTFLAPAPVFGIIKPDTSMKLVYGMCGQVISGEITAVDSSKRAIQVKVVKASSPRKIKLGEKWGYAKAPAGPITVELAEPSDLVGRVARGKPVLIFVGRRGAAIHLADGWLKATQAGASWKTTGALKLNTTFPGRTALLAEYIGELMAGKDTMVARVNHHTMNGGWKPRANLGIKGKAMAVGQVDGDKRPDLLVVTSAGGVKLYKDVGGAGALKDVSGVCGLAGATAGRAVFGDFNADGKDDLLLDKLWINTGGKFVASKAGVNLKGRDVLDVAMGNANGDKHTDAVAILKTGELLVFANPGKAGQAWPVKSVSLWKSDEPVLAAHLAYWMRWGDPSVMAIRKDDLTHYELDGTATVGCMRLTGKPPMTNKHLRDRPNNVAWFPVLDYMCSGVMDNNGGDGRPDLVMATHKSKKGHDLVVQNFGFGRFFINHEGHIAIEHRRRRGQPAAFKGRGKTPVVAFASSYDINPAWSISSILALLEDGRLFIGDSVACHRGRPIIPGTATADLKPMTGGARGNSDVRPR